MSDRDDSVSNLEERFYRILERSDQRTSRRTGMLEAARLASLQKIDEIGPSLDGCLEHSSPPEGFGVAVRRFATCFRFSNPFTILLPLARRDRLIFGSFSNSTPCSDGVGASGIREVFVKAGELE